MPIMQCMNTLRLLSILFLFTFSIKAATLSGTIRDSEGAAIANAHVVIHWDPAGSNYLSDNIGTNGDKTAATDEKGQFSLELPSGFYDVFVTATAFSPNCEKIRIEGKDTHAYKVRLAVSKLASKELD